ncbi:MAG TPA: hypothetical protein VFX96_09270 [Pyrinomonadaceae bacterium]|nr:hypothetical protein [Pyrinomonadaceae bacterium]
MNKESKSYVPIIAALITGGATLAVGVIANFDKLFPERPDGSTEIIATADPTSSTNSATPGTTQTTTPTPVISPTLTPMSPLPPSPPKEAQLEGVYEFVGQNFEPRPLRSRMLIRSVGGNRFAWETEGLFGTQLIRSRGKLRREDNGGWVGSFDYSDDQSIPTHDSIPTEVTFDGATLTVRNMRDGNTISWRKL